jgi:hypothetical protein
VLVRQIRHICEFTAMKFLALEVVVMACAATSACLVTGCSSSANESGNGVVKADETSVSNTPAPANMEDFYKQQKEMEKAARAKKGSRPSR